MRIVCFIYRVDKLKLKVESYYFAGYSLIFFIIVTQTA